MFYNRCALTCILKNKKENQINNSILNTSSVWNRPRGVVYNYAEKCCLQPAENGYRCVKTKINTAPKQFTTNAFSPVFRNDALETICDLKLQPGATGHGSCVFLVQGACVMGRCLPPILWSTQNLGSLGCHCWDAPVMNDFLNMGPPSPGHFLGCFECVFIWLTSRWEVCIYRAAAY